MPLKNQSKDELEIEYEALNPELLPSGDTELIKKLSLEENTILQGGIFSQTYGALSNSLKTVKASIRLVDDGSFNLKSATTGWGFVMAGDNTERTWFSWTTAGVVTLTSNSANAVATDTDTKLCVFDGGTYVTIKNRLGSSQIIRYEINYS